MNFKEKVAELLRKTEQVDEWRKLASGCRFIDETEVVCDWRTDGDSRHPYATDGLTLWAHSTGEINVEEGAYRIIGTASQFGKEPNVAFFYGVQTPDGFRPVSITGSARDAYDTAVRKVVFTPDAAYYFAESYGMTACARLFVDRAKRVRISLYLKNGNDKPVETYLSTYIFACLYENFAPHDMLHWYRCGEALENGYLFNTREGANRSHFMRVARDCAAQSTTSHAAFAGGLYNQIYLAPCLRSGKLDTKKAFTEFTDDAIVGDMIPLTLKAGEETTVSYTLAVRDNADPLDAVQSEIATAEIDKELYRAKDSRELFAAVPQVRFDGCTFGVGDEAFNLFLKSVMRQVEFVARAKNYAGSLIGVRDIFQQLEAALLWIPDYCRGKIVNALGNIGSDGRAPRQYSYASNAGVIPRMDLRPYIDQGVWVISTVYTYLAVTGDYSILDEVCGYYTFEGDTVLPCADRDTVLDHLLRITDYLTGNLDDKTGCLHILYGDWNDALDGLGKTDVPGKFGDGVTVMATLQLYRNLHEMCDILTHTGKFIEKIPQFRAKIESIKRGLQTFAIEKNDKGLRKILHGWGNGRKYKVGSFSDADGKNRDGATSNAFWVLSGAIDWDATLKADILRAYDRLDSKYGIKTFEPHFEEKDTAFGRIGRLPKGTAENAATYIHATMFAIQSLFRLGEGERAWAQLVKVLPITHKYISTTPFVMPNSYIENAEKGFDGESMSDWFTGSGCVLIKLLAFDVFGLKLDLDGLQIVPPDFKPYKKAVLPLEIRGSKITIEYEKTGNSRLSINGETVEKIALSAKDLGADKAYVLKVEY